MGVNVTVNEPKRLRWWLRWPIRAGLLIYFFHTVKDTPHQTLILVEIVAISMCFYFLGRADEERAAEEFRRKTDLAQKKAEKSASGWTGEQRCAATGMSIASIAMWMRA